jgi:hypothetical protein
MESSTPPPIRFGDILGQTSGFFAADGNGNGSVDAGDYDVWKMHFGETIGGGGATSGQSTAVPEPSSLAICFVALVLLVAIRSSRLRSVTLATVACPVLWAATAGAAVPVPSGLQPGDHQLIFATSDKLGIDISPGGEPTTFSGLTSADLAVTWFAWQANLLPSWNFVDPLFHAVLSTNGHNAKDRVNITGPIYNFHGDVIVTDANDLWDGSIANPVRFDEYGSPQGSAVWTGTNASGVWIRTEVQAIGTTETASPAMATRQQVPRPGSALRQALVPVCFISIRLARY